MPILGVGILRGGNPPITLASLPSGVPRGDVCLQRLSQALLHGHSLKSAASVLGVRAVVQSLADDAAAAVIFEESGEADEAVIALRSVTKIVIARVGSHRLLHDRLSTRVILDVQSQCKNLIFPAISGAASRRDAAIALSSIGDTISSHWPEYHSRVTSSLHQDIESAVKRWNAAPPASVLSEETMPDHAVDVSLSTARSLPEGPLHSSRALTPQFTPLVYSPLLNLYFSDLQDTAAAAPAAPPAAPLAPAPLSTASAPKVFDDFPSMESKTEATRPRSTASTSDFSPFEQSTTDSPAGDAWPAAAFGDGAFGSPSESKQVLETRREASTMKGTLDVSFEETLQLHFKREEQKPVKVKLLGKFTVAFPENAGQGTLRITSKAELSKVKPSPGWTLSSSDLPNGTFTLKWTSQDSASGGANYVVNPDWVPVPLKALGNCRTKNRNCLVQMQMIVHPDFQVTDGKVQILMALPERVQSHGAEGWEGSIKGDSEPLFRPEVGHILWNLDGVKCGEKLVLKAKIPLSSTTNPFPSDWGLQPSRVQVRLQANGISLTELNPSSDAFTVQTKPSFVMRAVFE